jgi:hypothetical protein
LQFLLWGWTYMNKIKIWYRETESIEWVWKPEHEGNLLVAVHKHGQTCRFPIGRCWSPPVKQYCTFPLGIHVKTLLPNPLTGWPFLSTQHSSWAICVQVRLSILSSISFHLDWSWSSSRRRPLARSTRLWPSTLFIPHSVHLNLTLISLAEAGFNAKLWRDSFLGFTWVLDHSIYSTYSTSFAGWLLTYLRPSLPLPLSFWHILVLKHLNPSVFLRTNLKSVNSLRRNRKFDLTLTFSFRIRTWPSMSFKNKSRAAADLYISCSSSAGSDASVWIYRTLGPNFKQMGQR